MTRRVVYEVNLTVGDEFSRSLTDWLPGHVEDMLALPGFIEARRFDPRRVDAGWVHTVEYVLTDRAALDEYLDTHAARMRQPAIDRFGDNLTSSRSIRELTQIDVADPTLCLNCGAQLEGQYCWNCGQRANTRLISLFELLRDAFGDMFEFDSRLWRTLIPLMAKPGHLTAEYLRGRRARFMPPFRMYLVLSFIFFLLAQTLGDGVGVSITDDDFVEPVEREVEDESPETGEGVDAAPTPNASNRPEQGRAEGNDEDIGGTDAETDVAPDSEEADTRVEDRIYFGVAESDDEEGFECNIGGLGDTGVGWIDRSFSEERAKLVCQDIYEDRGKRFLEQWIDKTPVMALAMLPLMALLLKSMYPLSRRYFVEHLLMLVHFHSFLFLLWSLGLIFNALVEALSIPTALAVIVNVIGWLYVPVYLYRSIRAVYGQGRWWSGLKFGVMSLGYIFTTAFVVVITVLFLFATY